MIMVRETLYQDGVAVEFGVKPKDNTEYKFVQLFHAMQ